MHGRLNWLWLFYMKLAVLLDALNFYICCLSDWSPFSSFGYFVIVSPNSSIWFNSICLLDDNYLELEDCFWLI